MSFATHGFMSAGSFQAAVRDVPDYKPWFTYADGLNRLGLDMLQDLEVAADDMQRVTIAALFARAHHSFQAALLLAERGLLADSRVVLRSGVEGAIATIALANDPLFLDQLIDAHHFYQRKTARLVLNNPDYAPSYPPEQIAQMQATIAEVDAIDAARTTKISDIKWANVAVKHCRDLYELLYRTLSTDGTHTNIHSIHRYMMYDQAGKFSGFKVGPDIDGMIDTLKAACLMFLWAADPFAQAFPRDGLEDRIRAQLQRFDTLPQNEPVDVSVVEIP
jgi:Family of unknown function (DUF5677)